MKETRALVVLSGGQDSVTCLGWALDEYDLVYAIGFNYGQKHSVELEQAKKICELLSVPFEVFDIPSLAQIGDSALISGSDVNEKHVHNENLPSSFVPNRNAMFLTIAHAYAQAIEAKYIVTGVCETDYSGYPDCRQDFITGLNRVLNAGSECDLHFVTPLMHLNKRETFELAEQVGILPIVIEYSHTCYNGDREHRHDWGFGCNDCPACNLRSKGWQDYTRKYQGPF